MRFLFISSSCPPLGSMCQDTDRLWRTVGPLILWFAEGPAPADSNRGGKSRGIYITLGSPIKGLLCMKGHTSGASLAPAPLLLEALIPGSLGASPDQPAWRGYTRPHFILPILGTQLPCQSFLKLSTSMSSLISHWYQMQSLVL